MAGSKGTSEAHGDLRLSRLTKEFGSFTAVDGIDLLIPVRRTSPPVFVSVMGAIPGS